MHTKSEAIWDKHTSKPQGRGMWKNIQKQREVIEQLSIIKISKGNAMSFWEDIWDGTQNLKTRFPLIYKLALAKNSSVRDMIKNNTWDIKLRRNLHQPEMSQMLEVLGTPPTLEDELICTASGGFSPKTCYKWLIQQLPATPSDVPFYCIWIQFVPPKV
ncbi:uncharacterized protein LOC113291692 [Papaver somniferum]|uniref:uncharacterized protein LOC113291692 n=1 Tax=Papaver somniferum TaxID=3469 RepID=UPI000E6F87D9|nr:uncharacterized protein LOC113291692 [Papaver somniferum]